MIKRKTGLQLGDYLQENVFGPPGIPPGRLTLGGEEEMLARLVPTTKYDENGVLVPVTAGLSSLWPEPGQREHYGGIDLHGSAPDFLHVLSGIFLDPNGPILEQSTIESMLEPQVKDEARLKRHLVDDAIPMFINAAYASVSTEIRVNYGLSGLLSLEDIPGQRKAGSLSWGGLPNCNWWIDREAGVAGVNMMSLLPAGLDAPIDLLKEFEKDIYRQIASK